MCANPEDGLEIFSKDGILLYSRDRNNGGRNVDFMNTTLRIDEVDLAQPLAVPSAITQQARAVLFTKGEAPQFGGYTEYIHSYWGVRDSNGDYDRYHRLDQEVKVKDMPARTSPNLKTVSIQRVALDGVGDMVYGHMIFQNKKVTDRLGIKTTYDDPVFLVFLPDRVLATTYGPNNEVLAEMPYALLANVGIRARFSNEQDKARLSIGERDQAIILQLGKKLKPDYAAKLFSPYEELITDSGISVSKFPEGSLN